MIVLYHDETMSLEDLVKDYLEGTRSEISQQAAVVFERYFDSLEGGASEDVVKCLIDLVHRGLRCSDNLLYQALEKSPWMSSYLLRAAVIQSSSPQRVVDYVRYERRRGVGSREPFLTPDYADLCRIEDLLALREVRKLLVTLWHNSQDQEREEYRALLTAMSARPSPD